MLFGYRLQALHCRLSHLYFRIICTLLYVAFIDAVSRTICITHIPSPT